MLTFGSFAQVMDTERQHQVHKWKFFCTYSFDMNDSEIREDETLL